MEERHFGPVWFIPGENKGKYPYCHSVYVEDAGVLIDPSSDRNRLLELKKTSGVKEVWLSHWHEDHFMHLDLFDDLPLCMMEADAVPLSDMEGFMDAYGLDEQEKEDWRPLFVDTFHFIPRTPSRFLHNREWIDLGSTRVQVIGTPGHTPGHAALFFEAPDLLFMGDYDLSTFGPWYGDVDSSIVETRSSVDKLRTIPASKWITSHARGVFETEPGPLWDTYLDVIRIREDKLMDFLEKPRTLSQIIEAGMVYGKSQKPGMFFEFSEKALMKKHLEKLISENRIFMVDGWYSI